VTQFTVFRNSNNLIAAARHENYRRGILIFEKTIAELKNKLNSAQDFIAKLQIERSVTTDKQRLQQIDIDITYVQNSLNNLQPEQLFMQYNEKLARHKRNYEKFCQQH
jgi:hypothetical protein